MAMFRQWSVGGWPSKRDDRMLALANRYRLKLSRNWYEIAQKNVNAQKYCLWKKNYPNHCLTLSGQDFPSKARKNNCNGTCSPKPAVIYTMQLTNWNRKFCFFGCFLLGLFLLIRPGLLIFIITVKNDCISITITLVKIIGCCYGWVVLHDTDTWMNK